MILDHPQNISLKINSIQDNIKYLYKAPDSPFKPYFIHNSNISNISHIYQTTNSSFQNYSTNNSLEDFVNISKFNKENLFQNNSTGNASDFSYNFLNCSNGSMNTFEYTSFKPNFDSKFNSFFSINNSMKNSEIIESKFDDELNSIHKNKKEVFKSNNKALDKFKIEHNKLKQKRKYKPDDIRKKIKSRFHKSIRNIINENLKKAGSKYFFSFLPQIFISSISRGKNCQTLNLSYKELLKKDFVSDIDEKKYKNKKVDISKYKNNLLVLDYLDKNPDICKKSGFDIISNMKYSDLLEEYFKSEEFDKSIIKLREENEEEYYINEYINKAKNYVKFFSQKPLNLNINKNKKNNE